MAQAEICNGVDDDCDTVVDDGCPADGGSISIGGGGTSSEYGGTTTNGMANTRFELTCPAGTAIVGFHARAVEAINTLGAYCAAPTVHRRAAGVPYQYEVLATDSSSLPEVGVEGSGAAVPDQRCPEGQFVVGVHIWTGSHERGDTIQGLTAICSPYEVTGGAGAAASRSGSPVELERIGTGNAATATTAHDFSCPEQQLINRIVGHYGPWPVYPDYFTVNAMKLDCGTLGVPVVSAP